MDGGEVLSLIDGASLLDGAGAEIVNGAQADREAEVVDHQFLNAAKRASATQQQSQHQGHRIKVWINDSLLAFL